ncbi:MAG TPA: hypothetical protein VL971_02825 [Rhizomicrobium sp.]|nr:hypothetical protein [Rhizomicrobium sp.]
MHAFVTITAMAVIFAAHVAVMLELRPRRNPAAKQIRQANSGDAL